MIYDAGEDGHQFIDLFFDGARFGWCDTTLFAQEFKPELAFIDLPKSTSQLGNEIGLGPGT